jgi:nitrogen fixation protein FixH
MTERVMSAWWVARMPVLVGAICAASLTSVGLLVFKSGGTAAIGIEPDYYRKGLEWDRLRAEKAKSDALGWKASVEIIAGERAVLVRLADASGLPVDDAVVSGEAFAHRESSKRAALTFAAAAGESGTYVAGLSQTKALVPGKWRVSLTAVRGDDRFVLDRDVEVHTP